MRPNEEGIETDGSSHRDKGNRAPVRNLDLVKKGLRPESGLNLVGNNISKELRPYEEGIATGPFEADMDISVVVARN